jgi:protein-L-isoaspartate(D-aspartate) O-methyltransferase
MKSMQQTDIFLAARRRMVETQIVSRGIHDSRVLEVFSTIPRHLFVSSELQPDAYEDHPLPIGYGQTISQPYIVALMTSLLKLEGSENVLEVGTGCGYQAAILGSLAAEVHTIERIKQLSELAEANLASLGYRNVHVHVGDGSLGWPDNAPYEGILVTAASPSVPPSLIDQLSIGGKLIIPVGERWRQILEMWIKHSKGMEKKEILPVVFVPLKGEQGWQDFS